MTLTSWLLVGISALFFILVLQVSALSALLRTLFIALGNDISRAQNSMDEIKNAVGDCSTNLEHLKDSISEIYEVMRIIQRYKLPSQREQRDLDELAFEEEHLRRVTEALRGSPRETKDT